MKVLSIKKFLFLVLFVAGSISFVSIISCCTTKSSEVEYVNEALILIDYLEEDNGNIINSALVPSLINADVLYQNLKGKNYKIIDLRSEEEFNSGHIENSVRIAHSDILHYIENIIEPNSYEKIVLVCSNSFLSTYVNSILLHLGYKNIYSLRYGLSSWNNDIAENYWLAATSSHLEGKLDKTGYPKPSKGELPILKTGKTLGYHILRQRAHDALQINYDDINISISDVMEDPQQFFIINYWDEATYNKGHLPGAIQYSPKKSLMKDAELLTLPTDKPIVVYCYTATHSGFVVGYLRLLGYEAFNLKYGTNAFINRTMLEEQSFFRGFQQGHVNSFPLVTGDETEVIDKPIENNIITIEGGC